MTIQMASLPNAELTTALRRAVNQARVQLRKDAAFTALPLRHVRRICRFAAGDDADADDDAADHEDRVRMDRSVGATLCMLAELFVLDVGLAARSADESALRRALAQFDFLRDILHPDAASSDSGEEAEEQLDLGAYRLVDEAARDVGRLWLQLYCDRTDRRKLLCKGRVDLLLVPPSAAAATSLLPPRLTAEFRDCSATPRRMIFECDSACIVGTAAASGSDRASLVRGTFEFNDAARIDLSGESRVTRCWRDANSAPLGDADVVDTLSDRGTALLKFSFARAAVVDGLSGMLRTDAMYDCFPERDGAKK
jgi:hypothetical protein